MTARIANTFTALSKNGDFKIQPPSSDKQNKSKNEEGGDADVQDSDSGSKNRGSGLRAEFQYVIQIQLPSNGSEDTYLNIFNAIRKTFQ